jgi:hypothetical protein
VGPDPSGGRDGRGGHVAAGWAVVVNEPIAPSDVIVVSLDSGGAAALEAADLVKSGIATRVAVFRPSGWRRLRVHPAGAPLRGCGREPDSPTEVAWRDGYHAIPRTDVGTEGEGQVLPPWCDQHQFRSIVFVAAWDHSRRLRRVLDRVIKGPRTRVTVRPARHSNFDPDRWWETHDGVRTEIVEFQKLVLETKLHAISFFTSSLSNGMPGVLPDRAHAIE